MRPFYFGSEFILLSGFFFYYYSIWVLQLLQQLTNTLITSYSKRELKVTLRLQINHLINSPDMHHRDKDLSNNVFINNKRILYKIFFVSKEIPQCCSF